MIDYRLYLVTDDPSRYAGDWLDNVVASVEGGVTCVQYRDTESAPAERYARVRRLQDALKATHTPLVINNEAELAAAVNAEGVHVGQHDMPPAQVRSIVGPDCEIGLSITEIGQLECIFAQSHNVAQTRLALSKYTLQCLGIGPVFDARKTKADAADAMGVAGLAAIVAAKPALPCVAIGGITLDNAADVLSSGVDGLAVVSAFSKAKDPYEIAKRFTLLLDHRRQ